MPDVYVALTLLVTVVIGWLDYLTGPRLNFSLFYLIPVAAGGWYFGPVGAALIAAMASGATVAADLLWESGTGVSIWDGVSSFAIFAAVAWAVRQLRDDRDRLQEAASREARLARTDRVTTLANSRAFREALDQELHRTAPDGASIAVFVIDLDEFKSVNDRLGHAAGDDVLQAIAERIVRSIRPDDLAARLGGDEFGVLARGITPEAARGVAERIRRCAREVAAEYKAPTLGATVGVAYSPDAAVSVEDLVQGADAAMYEGKQSGKSRVIFRELP